MARQRTDDSRVAPTLIALARSAPGVVHGRLRKLPHSEPLILEAGRAFKDYERTAEKLRSRRNLRRENRLALESEKIGQLNDFIECVSRSSHAQEILVGVAADLSRTLAELDQAESQLAAFIARFNKPASDVERSRFAAELKQQI